MLIFFLLIVPCDHPDADYEQICGYGATGCLGNAIDPMCQCNIELQTKPSSNGSSCVPGKIFFLDNCAINLEKVQIEKYRKKTRHYSVN